MAHAADLNPCARAVGETTSRPNILWVVTEDNSPSFVGGYGDPLARTPFHKNVPVTVQRLSSEAEDSG